jgi:hypothetical protein
MTWGMLADDVPLLEEGNSLARVYIDTTVKRFIPQRHEDKVPTLWLE